MTTTEIIDNLKKSIDNLDLNSRALKSLSKIKATVPENSDDLYPSFLNGFSRDELIFKPQAQFVELYNYSGFDPSIITKIGIYILDTDANWVDNLKPIGYFEYQTDINGEYLNDHIEMTEKKHSS